MPLPCSGTAPCTSTPVRYGAWCPLTSTIFPDRDGTTPSKAKMVDVIRMVISQTGQALERPDAQGRSLQRFGGHSLRVAGAQLLAASGVPLVSNDQLVASEEQVWQPRSLLAILDGLSSIRWAYILLQVGPEQSVHSFFDWATKLARSRPQKPDQLNQWWVTVSWKLALELRGGRTWDEAAGPLQRDYDTFTECMGRDPVHIVKPPKNGGKSNTGPNPKGKGKYKQPRSQPYGRPNKGGYQQEYYTPRSQSSSWTSYTITPRAAGSRTKSPIGATINGTKVGPVPRNRDRTGSLYGGDTRPSFAGTDSRQSRASVFGHQPIQYMMGTNIIGRLTRKPSWWLKTISLT